jgi:hypothetical protein
MKYLLLLLLCGCAPYQSRIRLAGVALDLPKDASFDSLELTIPTTNGPIITKITKGVFKINPAAIDAKTAHDVGVINAVGDKVLQGVGAAVPK